VKAYAYLALLAVLMVGVWSDRLHDLALLALGAMLAFCFFKVVRT
jgi:hypothetical protein